MKVEVPWAKHDGPGILDMKRYGRSVESLVVAMIPPLLHIRIGRLVARTGDSRRAGGTAIIDDVLAFLDFLEYVLHRGYIRGRLEVCIKDRSSTFIVRIVEASHNFADIIAVSSHHLLKAGRFVARFLRETIGYQVIPGMDNIT